MSVCTIDYSNVGISIPTNHLFSARASCDPADAGVGESGEGGFFFCVSQFKCQADDSCVCVGMYTLC